MLQIRCIIFQVIISLLLVSPAVVVAEGAVVRFASFNIAMGLAQQGELNKRLQTGQDERLQKVAAIIQRVRPDVLLLNEFDSCEADSARLFVKNYLEVSQFGEQPISFAHSINGTVNTGQDSGLDLNNNGVLGEPADAWGFGRFPGQYGMLVLSRYPLGLKRDLQFFKWIDMPGALLPSNPDGTSWYPDEIREQLRLSSKSHRDIGVSINNQVVHFLVSHPTPPVFDGPEDRNGRRNHDEIRLWADYIDPERSAYINAEEPADGLLKDAFFVIAGDLNADPHDGDSHENAIDQLLNHPLINTSCVPHSKGGSEASRLQGDKNLQHQGDPAADTGDFNDKRLGNMRIDYVLPATSMKVTGCGVFWPTVNEPGHVWIDASDHRLVWLDVAID